jgi:MFS family permease
VEFVHMVIARQAGRREWISLAVLTIPCLLYAMDLTVLNLAVPQLSEDLQPSSTELLWIVDIYGFMAAGSLVTMGSLGDRIGRRRLLLIGAAAFGATSLLAAWSTSAAMLIAARALLGLAGATVAPSTLSLIRNMFADPRQRTVAVSVWITSFSVGGAIGPLLGGPTTASPAANRSAPGPSASTTPARSHPRPTSPLAAIRPCSASLPARVAMSTGWTGAACTRIRT